MPYSSQKQVPKQLKKLGLKRANQWSRVYDKLKSKYGKERAAKIAWSTVKRKPKTEIAEKVAMWMAETVLDEKGFGYGSKATGFVRRKGSGFGGKKRRGAFFAKLKDKSRFALRFRAPSAQNVAGVTRLKKTGMKVSGGKAALQVKRKPIQAKRYVLRRGKYYSYASKLSRLGNPKVLGV